MESVTEELRKEWAQKQLELQSKLILEDTQAWQTKRITAENDLGFPGEESLQYVGGVDISFIKDDNVNACAAFVVCRFPDMKVVHRDLSMVKLTKPYIAGFLAFREADFLIEKIEKLRRDNLKIFPQVVLVDGNGLLHPREMGLACHMGVILDMPFIGVAKNLLHVPGLQRDVEFKDKIKQMERGGDSFELVGQFNRVYGLALRSCDDAPNPIYVSQGHRISLETAKWVVMKCIKYRIPEPTRKADHFSRDFLREQGKR
ncbi:DgyrCDS12517 [Dimorphilus gyrociliatus]|uniref:DgyrCDS12517 n=1 Tax=Dimorphilus gyrociliatus TaxID=2664684 RepID=A0A7I8W6P6_9ANNE|nr:DgyrCDS12517 [Dimorphilus gyrociliatus]